MGVDTDTYKIYWFNYVQNYTFGELALMIKSDNGFYILTKLIRLVTNDYWVWRSVIYALTFTLIHISINRSSKYVSLGMLIYFCTLHVMTCSLIRQALAIAICFAGYTFFLSKEKYMRFLLCLLLAMTMHKTALICILMLCFRLIGKKQMSNVAVIVLSVLSLLVFLVLIPIAINIYDNGAYIDSKETGGANLLILIVVITVILGMDMRKQGLNKNKEVSYIFNLEACTVFTQVGALRLAIFTRIKSYFSIYLTLLIPEIINSTTDIRRRIQYMTIIIAGFGIYAFAITGFPEYVMHVFK